jgi:hypothetical protein
MLNNSFRHIFGFETEEQNKMPPEVLHNNVIRICSSFEFSPDSKNQDGGPISLFRLLTDTTLFDDKDIVDIEVLKDPASIKAI